MIPASLSTNPEFRPLTTQDYEALEARWMTRELADAALLRRVNSIYGAEMVGRTGRGGDYAGVAIPYLWPGSEDVVLYRLRRDHPDMESGRDGILKPRQKYLSPPGGSNRLYLHPQTELALLADIQVPVVLVEGEFKTLALWRLAWHGLGDTAETPAFLPIGLQGVWSWRGVVGKTEDSGGWRVDVRGAVPDLARIAWDDRRVVIVFDADVETNDSVRDARHQLTRELEARGARVAWFGWPPATPESQKGIDDYLAANGPERTLRQLARAKLITKRRRPVSVAEAVRGGTEDDAWKAALIRGDKGIKPMLANAMMALRKCPEWTDVLAFNEFSYRTEVKRGTPWRAEDYQWGDMDDIKLAEWLQLQGIEVSRDIAGQASEAVAREHAYHPVRDYLDGLSWDETPRIDQWFPRYFGSGDTPYARAIGSKWLISAVARIMDPGCKCDHLVIIEGLQGLGKSTALRIMGGAWFTDQIDNLGSKDSLQQMQGVWIIEFGELSQLVSQLSTLEEVKTFLTRQSDRFRPPYGRRTADFPRQCIFSGSTNNQQYLRDETGGRRFWPIGPLPLADTEALARDRDQLWAEARTRYARGEKWWIPREDAALLAAAEEEQDNRFQPDTWDTPIWDYIVGDRSGWEASGHPIEQWYATMASILKEAVKKDLDQWTRMDSNRVLSIMRHRGFEYKRERLYDGNDEPLLDPRGKPLREYRFRWPLRSSPQSPSEVPSNLESVT